MLRVNSVSKMFGAEPVLNNVTFSLSSGRRAGLVGANGSGKSTLLRIIASQLQPDAGSVWLDPADSVAYLPQYPFDELGLTLREALLRDSPVAELERTLSRLEAAMQTPSHDLESTLEEYAGAREAFELHGGYEVEARMEEIISGLGLDSAGLDSRVAALSGGNKTKLSLGGLLLSRASILLLDEPTNYLDLRALLWLERFVAESGRSFIIVSHDRLFLDRTVDTILELDLISRTLREWPGTYTAYADAARREREKLAAAFADQQAEIKRIEQDIKHTKDQARGVESHTKSGLGADQKRRLAKKVARKAKVRERRLERELEGANTIEKPRQSWGLHLADLGTEPIEDDRLVVEVHDLRAKYENHQVLLGLDLVIRGRDRVALVGENGSGKTTLIRCLTREMPYEGTIRIGPSVRIGRLSQEAEELELARTVLDVFRLRSQMFEDEARTYLHKFLFAGDTALKPVGSLSYGQRAKLTLAILITSRANFLILDEPTNHMDLPALEAIETALSQYRGPLLLVSHDRYFMERLAITRVLVMDNGQLYPVDSMQEYEADLHLPYRGSSRTL